MNTQETQSDIAALNERIDAAMDSPSQYDFEHLELEVAELREKIAAQQEEIDSIRSRQHKFALNIQAMLACVAKISNGAQFDWDAEKKTLTEMG